MKEYFPKAVQVIPFNNYHIQIFFDDRKIVEYDLVGNRDLTKYITIDPFVLYELPEINS